MQGTSIRKCGIIGKWRRIANLDTTQGDSCPTNLRTVNNTKTGQTACGRTSSSRCSPLKFTISNDYSNVCGRVRGYQYHSMDAFAHQGQPIDGIYVDGVSITQGQPMKHLWTYAVGFTEQFARTPHRCPCAVPSGSEISYPPRFVGNEYYCESGFPGTDTGAIIVWEDPLWDGQNCIPGNRCCERYGWFFRQVLSSCDDITVRLCANEAILTEDVLIDQLEIWVM